MKVTKKTALLLVIALLTCFLSSACGIPDKVSTEPEPRCHYGSQVDFIPNEEVERVKLSELEYVRPDEQEVRFVTSGLYSLNVKVSTYQTAEDFIKDYYDILTRQRKIEAMYWLAYLRHDIDQTDTFYQAEVEYCYSAYNEIQANSDELMLSLANSPLRDDLETLLFGRNFFKSYDSNDYDYTEEEGELWNQEYSLCQAFLTATYEQYATYNGETKLLNEWLTSDSQDVRIGATAAYIEEYHDNLGQIYIDLVNKRNKIAQLNGYKNYAEYSYSIGEDYTFDKTKIFLSAVKTYAAPLVKKLDKKYPGLFVDAYLEKYPYPKDTEPYEALSSACKKMGGLIWEACQFLTESDWCDYSFSPTKRAIGYSSYLPYYELPIVFINPAKYDIINTLFHEFGHNVDHYYHYGCDGVDSTVGEMYSQSMEYLALKYTDAFPEDIQKESIRVKMARYLIKNVLEECLIADFEEQVYSLKESELTLEKLDEIWLQCWNDYGLLYIYPEETVSKRWIYVHHLYSHPCYCLNYATTVVGALQICELEEEKKGEGVKVYEEMIKTTAGMSFAEVFENCPLDNPLEENTVKKISEFLKKMLELE